MIAQSAKQPDNQIQFVLLKKINLASFVFVMDKSYNMASTKDLILHTTSSFL